MEKDIEDKIALSFWDIIFIVTKNKLLVISE